MTDMSTTAVWPYLSQREQAEVINLEEAIAEREDELLVLRAQRTTLYRRASNRRYVALGAR